MLIAITLVPAVVREVVQGNEWHLTPEPEFKAFQLSQRQRAESSRTHVAQGGGAHAERDS